MNRRGLMLDAMAVTGLALVGFGLWRAVSLGVACIVLGAFLLAGSVVGAIRR